jgi:S1-C subfamily serine protease
MFNLRSPRAAALAMIAALLLSAPAAKCDDLKDQREQLDRQLQEAHRRMEDAVREITDLSMKMSGEAEEMAGGSRAMLGINIGEGGASDPNGVRVISVSPGGPADVAGLKANDVITSYQGKDLRADPDRNPRQKLLGLIHASKPDVPVAVEYRRGDKALTAQIVPKSMTRYYEYTLPHELEGLKELENIGPIFARRGAGGFGSVELVDLSPGLGHYFGTEHGLLVVRAPRDERLKLQDGDVILDIDGRVPTGASHAFEILSSYRAGETLKLHIMRQQKRMELPIEMPAERERKEARADIRILTDGEPALPAPPAAPAPPAPPRESTQL